MGLTGASNFLDVKNHTQVPRNIPHKEKHAICFYQNSEAASLRYSVNWVLLKTEPKFTNKH